MEDKESGSLSQKQVLELLVELFQGTVTGSLKLERAPLQKAVYFRDGQILFAASNDPKDQLASILVEEGKLGPDQMQVAQARVSPGNPLAKVLTELGYISQRELAEAARIKVEKILTDLYTWKEGTYQFATKSLPKGAIDLELSTPQLLAASIRRIQDRDWVLEKLGSLDAVLAPSETLETYIADTKADGSAAEILHQVDGEKSVKQIGSVSSLGEFEVCKVLAAALVQGALTQGGGGASVPAADDAFSIPAAPDDAFTLPTNEPAFDVGTPSPEIPAFGGETTEIPSSAPAFPPATEPLPEPVPPPIVEPEPAPPPIADASTGTEETIFQPPDDTVFQEASEQTVFQPPPSSTTDSSSSSGGLPLEPPPPPLEPPPPPLEPPPPPLVSDPPRPDLSGSSSASDLLIDESSDSEGFSARTPPRPKGMRSKGGSRDMGGIVKIAGVVLLVGLAAFSVYYFVWPMLSGGEDGSGGTAVATGTPPASGTSPSSGSSGGTGTPDPRATGGTPAPTPPDGGATPPGPAPPPTSTEPPAASAPQNPGTTSTPPASNPTPGPRPPRNPSPSPTPSSSGNGRALLANGNISGAANAFLTELSASASNQFTVAVGLYCNQDNVGRLVKSTSGGELYVLPTTVDGRRCYRVVWGLFDTRQAAQGAMGSLPSNIRAGDSAAVPLAPLLR